MSVHRVSKNYTKGFAMSGKSFCWLKNTGPDYFSFLGSRVNIPNGRLESDIEELRHRLAHIFHTASHSKTNYKCKIAGQVTNHLKIT